MTTAQFPEKSENNDKWDGSDIEPSNARSVNAEIIKKLNELYYSSYSQGDRFS